MLIIEKNRINQFRELTICAGSLLKKYEQIKRLFFQESNIFSEPIQNHDNIEWTIDKSSSISNYSLVSESEQNHIKYILKKQVMSLYGTKIVQEDEEYFELLDDLLEIPNYGCIYLVDNKVFLTNWGHIEDRYNAPRGIIKELIKNIEIEVSSSDVNVQENIINEELIIEQKTMEGKQGDPRINLKWYNHNDLDLYVIDPCGNEINFTSKEAFCKNLRGILDVDANVSEDDLKDKPQENIVWEEGGSKGLYRVLVKDANNRTGSATLFKLTIINNGEVSHYDESVEIGEFKEITTFEH